MGVKTIKTYAERMRGENVDRAIMVVEVRLAFPCCWHSAGTPNTMPSLQLKTAEDPQEACRAHLL